MNKKAILIAICIVLAVSVCTVIASLTSFYEKPSDAYLKEPLHMLPENVYYDTIVSELDTIRISEEDALWIALVKPLSGEPKVMVTHMELSGEKYKYDELFATLYDPTAEPRLSEDGRYPGCSDKLICGKTVHYDLYVIGNGIPVDPLFASKEHHAYKVVLEGKEYELHFYYYVE